ncbi:MAG: TetR/AcrR family transcriptional regulator [Acidipropionibacterium sp.]|jgi:AcrR family transcriptional regulator|nr:TetR/AcrR family transcriptional regulator [Acidipropionibacterium sp.]
MPTGVVLRDPRAQLFAAAERVLLRDGPEALTSRSVTAEAGVAKGVLHRCFADMEEFLTELVRDRAANISWLGETLAIRAEAEPVVSLVCDGLTEIFQPATLALIGLVAVRSRVRERLQTGSSLPPVLAEAVAALSGCLAAEQNVGRLRHDAEPGALAFALVGTGHLLFAGELGGLPDRSAVEEVVEGLLVGALPGAPEI